MLICREVRSSSTLAKILTLMMVNIERERQIWLVSLRNSWEFIYRI